LARESAKTLRISAKIEDWLGGRDLNPDNVVQRGKK